MNKIDDALKALPDGLTWKAAIRSHDEAALLWKISGEVGLDDRLDDVDRRRLADALVKANKLIDTDKENITMTSTNEAGDAMSLVSNTDREYILAAAKHRRQLQQSDTESIFDIAARLKKAVEAARAADARRKPADDAALSDTDLCLHRPGWRLNDDSTWRHDRREKRTTEEYDPEGRQQATYVSSEEEDDEDKRNGNRSEEALSDSKAARAEYLDYLHNAYKQGR